MSEKEFMAQIVELAKLRGWVPYHTHDSRRSQAGFPDLVLMRGAGHSVRILVAELKTDEGEATVEQEAWLRAFEWAGIPTYLWQPKDWPEIERALE